MQVTEHIHALRIPFKIPVSPEQMIDREVYSYIIFGNTITLIDTGVTGTETTIFDYIKNMGRDPKEITSVILTHSHPDHIGAIKAIKETTNCNISAHKGEKNWIEDTEKQLQERPVPGFKNMVGGSVPVDRLLTDGEIVNLDNDIVCKIIHTPGHSRGSISLHFKNEKAIITGDALPLPKDIPVYEDFVTSIASINKLKKVKGIETLLSSFEKPILGAALIKKRIDDSSIYLHHIDEIILGAKNQFQEEDLMELCRYVINEIGLPSFVANPLVARAFTSHLTAINSLRK